MGLDIKVHSLLYESSQVGMTKSQVSWTLRI